jgi:uncharacterized membrane protein
MMKYAAPMKARLKHLHAPHSTSTEMSGGQLVAEHVAGAIGSWRFIGAQATAMAIWVLINTLVFTQAIRFDGYPFVFLNLAMSAEAAFTGPILLIAANVGAIRDRAQTARIEALAAKNEGLEEQLLKMEQQILARLDSIVQEHAA